MLCLSIAVAYTHEIYTLVVESSAEAYSPYTRYSFSCALIPPSLHLKPIVVFYFRQSSMISEIKLVEMMEVICRCLDDEIVEVREIAAT